ncbi:hypothetical protein C0993_007816 [Termitomyces sp. T159_Od127]|nr:hypothetical protein C0993_007816 [Termitomyces sp. T159_Od127]
MLVGLEDEEGYVEDFGAAHGEEDEVQQGGQAGESLRGPDPSAAQDVDVEDEDYEKKMLRSEIAKKSKPIKSYRESPNEEGLHEIYDYIQANGKMTVPEAARSLADIMEDDLRDKIRSKWSYMALQWKNMKKAGDEQEERRQREEELLDEEENESKVLNARKRKRVKSAYTDAKYDSAFILNVMSNYEDDPDRHPDEPTQYIRRRPDYRSETVSRLYEEIDKISDPLLDKEKAMITRRNGTVIKNSKPPVARFLVNCIRAWQVSSELLETHPKWFNSKRVAKSGLLWGDPEDPQEEKPKKKQSSGGNLKEGILKKKKTINKDRKERIAKADEKLQELLGDDNLENVFDA